MSRWATMRSRLQIEEADESHAREIYHNLSAYGKEDLHVSGADLERLRHEINCSTICHAAIWDGQVAALWGVRPHSMFAGDGYIWLVSSSAVEAHPFQFIRYAKIIMDGLLDLFPTLHGIVLPKDERNIRWLRLLGFTVGKPEEVHGDVYRRFVRRRA